MEANVTGWNSNILKQNPMKKSRHPSYPQLSAPLCTITCELWYFLLHPSLAQANVSDGLKHLQGANGRSRIEDESATI